MTKKDYELIAQAIKEYINYRKGKRLTEKANELIITQFIGTALYKTNPKFDFKKFLKSCGVE